jgi:hypothetical protein
MTSFGGDVEPSVPCHKILWHVKEPYVIRKKEELPHQWEELIVIPIHKKGDKTDNSNYQGISLPSTSYKILSSL